MCIGAARGPLRARLRGKTSPARLHRSFASSRCFITIALSVLSSRRSLSPLRSLPPLPRPRLTFSVLRRAWLATLSRGKLDRTLYERRADGPVNLASERRSHPLIVIPKIRRRRIGTEIFFLSFSPAFSLSPFFSFSFFFFSNRGPFIPRVRRETAPWRVSTDVAAVTA